jgi:hypothetical protein
VKYIGINKDNEFPNHCFKNMPSMNVDLRKWKTATGFRIGRRFEDWTSIRDWTSNPKPQICRKLLTKVMI